jgi:hypothetical protein
MTGDTNTEIEGLVAKLVELTLAVTREYGIQEFTYRSMPTPSLTDRTPQCTILIVTEDGDRWVAYDSDDNHFEGWDQEAQVNFLIVSEAFIRALISHGRDLVAKRKQSVAAAEATLARLGDFRNVDLESKGE